MRATIYRTDGTRIECEGTAAEIAELEATGAEIKPDDDDFDAFVRAHMNPRRVGIEPGRVTEILEEMDRAVREVFGSPPQQMPARTLLLGPGVSGEEHTYTIGVGRIG